LRARISALEESLRSSAAESEPLREQRREAETQLASARAELETVKRNCEAHEVKLREIGEAFAVSERERLALALKVADDTSSKELAAAREKVTQLQTQVVDAQNTLLTMRGERDKVRQTLAERDQRLEQESQALATANSDIEKAKQEAATSQTTTTATPTAQVPGAAQPAVAITRDQALANSPRLIIETPELQGSINLAGAQLDDLQTIARG